MAVHGQYLACNKIQYVQKCVLMRCNKLYVRYHKVSPNLKIDSYWSTNKCKSVKHEVVWKWQKGLSYIKYLSSGLQNVRCRCISEHKRLFGWFSPGWNSPFCQSHQTLLKLRTPVLWTNRTDLEGFFRIMVSPLRESQACLFINWLSQLLNKHLGLGILNSLRLLPFLRQCWQWLVRFKLKAVFEINIAWMGVGGSVWRDVKLSFTVRRLLPKVSHHATLNGRSVAWPHR